MLKSSVERLRARRMDVFLGFGCVLSAIVGGGIGLLLGKYPYFVITSALGCMLAPGALCWVFVKKAARKL
jgi:hypothetical protein